jgi:hypothetical protein
LRNLAHQGNARSQAIVNDAIHFRHILGDQGQGCGGGVRRS